MMYLNKVHYNSFLFIFIFITGCGTPYGPRGLLGGYEEKIAGENLVEVTFYGNQHTSSEKTMARLLYRCAETTLDRGFDSFVIIRDQSYSKETVHNTAVAQPGRTISSMSGGVKSVLKPDFTRPTTNTDWVGVYVIAVFNMANPDYALYLKSRLDPEAIMSELATKIN